MSKHVRDLCGCGKLKLRDSRVCVSCHMRIVNVGQKGQPSKLPRCLRCGNRTNKTPRVCARCLRDPHPVAPIFGSLDGEEWRIIPEFPDYAASNLGRIRRETATRQARSQRVLRSGKHPRTNYRTVILFGPNGDKKTRLVHSLVMAAFVGPRPPLSETNHIDGDKANNVLTNLEYVTKSQNTLHAISLGLRPYSNRRGRPK